MFLAVFVYAALDFEVGLLPRVLAEASNPQVDAVADFRPAPEVGELSPELTGEQDSHASLVSVKCSARHRVEQKSHSVMSPMLMIPSRSTL